MRRLRRIALAAALPAVLSAPFWGPRVLERTPWFRVRRVEVSGVRMIPPHEVLAASRIRAGESVWRDPGPWRAALRGHPGVEDARVVRRLPATLRIEVREKRPVGLVQTGTLLPVTVAGEVLPADPARVPLDLPLLRVTGPEGGRGTDAALRSLAAEVGRLGELDPGLVARVSEAGWSGRGTIVLTLSSPDARILLPAGVESTRLRQLRAALEEIERRLPSGADTAGAHEPVDVDLRYQDQVVVRFPTRA